MLRWFQAVCCHRFRRLQFTLSPSNTYTSPGCCGQERRNQQHKGTSPSRRCHNHVIIQCHRCVIQDEGLQACPNTSVSPEAITGTTHCREDRIHLLEYRHHPQMEQKGTCRRRHHCLLHLYLSSFVVALLYQCSSWDPFYHLCVLVLPLGRRDEFAFPFTSEKRLRHTTSGGVFITGFKDAACCIVLYHLQGSGLRLSSTRRRLQCGAEIAASRSDHHTPTARTDRGAARGRRAGAHAATTHRRRLAAGATPPPHTHTVPASSRRHTHTSLFAAAKSLSRAHDRTASPLFVMSGQSCCRVVDSLRERIEWNSFCETRRARFLIGCLRERGLCFQDLSPFPVPAKSLMLGFASRAGFGASLSVWVREIERKFLVLGDAWRAGASGTSYVQGYLSRDVARIVRVRQAGPSAYLTIKGSRAGCKSTGV